MEISIKWNVCRVCLQEEHRPSPSGGDGHQQMRRIFADSKLAAQIYECSGITMKSDDCLPEKICRKCLTVLRYAVNFRTTCRNSDEYLQSVMQKTKSATSLFKLDKRREKTLELVDDVIDNIFEQDGDEEHEEEAAVDLKREESPLSVASKGDGEKRKRLSLTPKRTQENLNKKLKMEGTDSETDTVSSQPQTPTLPATEDAYTQSDTSDIEAQLPADHLDKNTLLMPSKYSSVLSRARKPNEHILIDLLEEEEDEQEEQEPEELEREVEEMEELEESYSKKSALPKTTSECSVEDDEFLEEAEEEQQATDAAEKNTPEDDEDLDDIFTRRCIDLKPLIFETHEEEEVEVEHHETSNKEDAYTSSPERTVTDNSIGQNTVELFYVLSDEIKHEYANEDGRHGVEVTDEAARQIEIIHIDDTQEVTHDNVEVGDEDDREYAKSDDTALKAGVVEYILEDESGDGTTDDNNPGSSSVGPPLLEVKKVKVNAPAETPKEQAQLKTRKSVPNLFYCELCGNNFTNRSLLNYHKRVHKNEKNFECELCFKRFNMASNLTAHMRIHTGEKRYECQFCGRRFTDRSTHVKHERIHTNEKPFTCTDCGKCFSLSTTLRAHEKIHTGEKPYKCDTCEKFFKLPHQLKAHFKTHQHLNLTVEQNSFEV